MSVPAAVTWCVSFLAVAWSAKVAVAALRIADSGSAWLTAPPSGPCWAAVALLYDDVWMTGLFALVTTVVAVATRAGAARWPGSAGVGRVVVAALYAALTFWMAFNIPVARLLSSPITYSFLHATGGALGDSIASYATLTNLGVPAVLWVGGLALPRVLRDRWRTSRRAAVIAATIVAVVALALPWSGPAAVSRVDTLGLHRNAVLALLETTLVRRRSDAQAFPPLSSPLCRPREDRDAAGPAQVGQDLAGMAGIARGRNVVWVILESIGARALIPYGAHLPTTPHLAELAEQALIFDHAYAAYPESIKGLFSILCARAPPLRSEASEYAVDRVPCRAVGQELARAGYRTGLFHSGWFAYLGMETVVAGRGFQTLEDAGAIASPHRSSFGVDDRATAQRLLAFVDQRPGAPFFAVYMPIAGHHPYRAPGNSTRPFPENNDREAYLNDVHVADDAFGVLRAGLQARGLDERTLYLVLGDHGEAFKEHEGNVAHALFLYEENVHVPLLVAAPGLFPGPRRVSSLASLVDLAPTTLGLAGLEIPPEYEGRSLLGGPQRVVRFFTEQGVRRSGVRDGRWKLILDQDSNRTQLFDLRADPGERNNLAAAHPDLVRRYRSCLGR